MRCHFWTRISPGQTGGGYSWVRLDRLKLGRILILEHSKFSFESIGFAGLYLLRLLKNAQDLAGLLWHQIATPSGSGVGSEVGLFPAVGLLPCLGHHLVGILGPLNRNKLATLLDPEPEIHAIRIDVFPGRVLGFLDDQTI